MYGDVSCLAVSSGPAEPASLRNPYFIVALRLEGILQRQERVSDCIFVLF